MEVSVLLVKTTSLKIFFFKLDMFEMNHIRSVTTATKHCFSMHIIYFALCSIVNMVLYVHRNHKAY